MGKVNPQPNFNDPKTCTSDGKAASAASGSPVLVVLLRCSTGLGWS